MQIELTGVASNRMAGEGPSNPPETWNSATPNINTMAAEIPSVGPNTIVLQLLPESNYKYWSTCVETYLVGQDLWEICTMKPEDIHYKLQDPVWRKKNAMALHAIQISCSPEVVALPWFLRFQSASEACNKILIEFGSPNSDSSTEVSEDADDEFSRYDELRKAIMHGDLSGIDKLLNSPEYQDALTENIASGGQTVLHYAVLSGRVDVIEMLMERIKRMNLLELPSRENGSRETPFTLAAVLGITTLAKSLVTQKVRELANTEDNNGILPVVKACNQANEEMTRFLYSHTQTEELLRKNRKNGPSLLSLCIVCKFTGIALSILKREHGSTAVDEGMHGSTAVAEDMHGYTPLYRFAGRPALLKAGSHLWPWQHLVYKCINVSSDDDVLTYIEPRPNQVPTDVDYQTEQPREHTRTTINVLYQLMRGLVSCPRKLLELENIRAQKLRDLQAKEILKLICAKLEGMNLNEVLKKRVHQAVILAVKQGNVEFVTKIIQTNPDLLLERDENGRNIFSIAVQYRQGEIFNLLHGLPEKNKFTCSSDSSQNTLLHLAAMLAPPDRLEGISGAALQMQSEIQWFEEVESIVPPICKEFLNSKGKTPKELFRMEHENLVKEGEKWMKGMAKSSSLVAVLIVTITFAAAFTITGGNNQDTVVRLLLDYNMFKVFIISDSISLFLGTTSVLMFLGILISGYAESQFLKTLPTKLIIGLFTLFISIAAMMIAFCAALATILKESSTKAVMMTLTISLACVPVVLLALMKFPLLYNVFVSTYRPGIFKRKIQPWCQAAS